MPKELMPSKWYFSEGRSFPACYIGRHPFRYFPFVKAYGERPLMCAICGYYPDDPKRSGYFKNSLPRKHHYIGGLRSAE